MNTRTWDKSSTFKDGAFPGKLGACTHTYLLREWLAHSYTLVNKVEAKQ